MGKKTRKIISMVLVLLMTCSNMVFATGKDYEKHWAEDSIESWISKGYVKGYQDGSFRPENDITRAEFISIVNRSFEFKEESEVTYKDVEEGHWAYDEFKRASAAGYIVGFEDGTFRPNNKITRQEVAAIVTRILKLKEAKNSQAFLTLNDLAEIPQWSAGVISAVVDKGYMKLRDDGSFAPAQPATRAEVIAALDSGYLNFVKIKYQAAGTYTAGTIDGSLEINAKDIILKDTTIHGNLIIGEGVGDGDVTLDNVMVKGDTIIQGGGMDSIIIENSQITNLIIEKKDGKVRILARGTTYVNNIEMNSGGKLESSDQDASNFGYVVIAEEIISPEPIILKGNFANVELKSGTNEIKVESGSIKNFVITTTAKDAKVDLAEGVEVDEMEVNAESKLDGKGKIKTVNANVSGVTNNVATDQVNTAEGVEKPKVTEAAPAPGPGSPTPTPAPTPVVSSDATLSDLKMDETTIAGFSAGKSEYYISLMVGTRIPVITARAKDPNASLVITQARAFDQPNNVAIVRVTAADGITTKTYTINLTALEGELLTSELEIVIANKREIWVSIRKGDPADNELIYDLKKADFTLTKDSQIVDFRFNDPNLSDSDIPGHEYLLSPMENESFSGIYTLTFRKGGYQVASENVVVADPHALKVEFQELLGIDAEKILICIFEKADDYDKWIDLQAGDLTLIKDFGGDQATVVSGIGLEPGGGTWEYNVLPPSGQTFTIGSYRLLFNKEGYEVAYRDFIIEEPLEAAKTAAERILFYFMASNTTRADDILNEVKWAFMDEGITAQWKAGAEFEKTDAQVNQAGSIRGTIELSDGKRTLELIVDKEIAMLVEVREAIITGVAKVGERLTASANVDASITGYQWQVADTVDGVYRNIDGATNQGLVLSEDQLGKFIKVVISGLQSSTATSVATEQVAAAYQGVTSVSGLLTKATVGTEIDLSTVTVEPDNASNKTIIWTLKDAGDTGVTAPEIAGGKFTPRATGFIKLELRIENGWTENRDYTYTHNIVIIAATPETIFGIPPASDYPTVRLENLLENTQYEWIGGGDLDWANKKSFTTAEGQTTVDLVHEDFISGTKLYIKVAGQTFGSRQQTLDVSTENISIKPVD